MKSILAGVGIGVLVLWFFGSIGIGNFVLMYGQDEIRCSK